MAAGAFPAETPLVLHAWLRSGNNGSARDVTALLSGAPALPPASRKLRTVRAGSVFSQNDMLRFLEERNIPCVLVVRLTRSLKHKVRCLSGWPPINADYARARFTLRLQGWSAPRSGALRGPDVGWFGKAQAPAGEHIALT